ncbi:hypothetical protein CNAG_01787 [Cryptococcus neoformans var. grubii H99]|uniref:Uncharacterized protein n=1 Tax=Cryptococcus neoformans (strain H99 / ATCC 208821 / CBS 10515 / FGSC 9487) TaxID=235443 RepID=J9VZB4_CRYN9|nr:hypothetical protein CNAG_01787 [Cryptococcus neoformans var. grubii H99]AFR97984.2 hypothetical protein CNAG_01787 [Cryptococcus neoformans var. grubii H99]AUB28072.1 hypothetical protein CKF44_01787 [Cryptococcus neoformans var. grubii]|eukprot:XP_012052454.1 hypothetical protein CNAG_01787 [Cryptococcus neoformans var. grubii H99]
MSLSNDAIPPSTDQEAAQGGLEREPMDIDDGQGYDDFPAIMVDEPLLETGFEGDGDADVIHDHFGHQLSKWPTKVPESLIPPYSCWQPSPYQDETIFHTESITRSMPLLATILAIISIFLTTFVGLPQRFGDMVKAVIQVILELAVTEDPQALCWRVCDKHYLLPVETSSSQLCKNVKTLYGQLDIDPFMVVHPKCPTKECQNVFVDVIGKGGWDEVPNNCPECGTALREGRKLVTEFFPHCTLQAKLEYLFSLDGVEQLVKDQQVLRSRQRQHDEQMERLAYLQDANPGKILHHQLDGSCYQVNDQDVQHEHGCLVLTINISIDWADPSKSCNHSPRSMGPIITPSMT